MVASAGAVVGTSTTWPSSVMMLSPVTRPTIAVPIGRPIATALPNVTSRIRIAAAIPTTSDVWLLGFETFWPR
jgi:hypothetical protein